MLKQHESSIFQFAWRQRKLVPQSALKIFATWRLSARLSNEVPAKGGGRVSSEANGPFEIITRADGSSSIPNSTNSASSVFQNHDQP